MTIFMKGLAKYAQDSTRTGVPFDKLESCVPQVEKGVDDYPKGEDATSIRDHEIIEMVESDSGDSYYMKALGINMVLQSANYSVRAGKAENPVTVDFGIYTVDSDGVVVEVASIASGVDLLVDSGSTSVAINTFLADQSLVSGTDGLEYNLGVKINDFPCTDADGVKSFGDINGTGASCCQASCLSFDVTVDVKPTSTRYIPESPCGDCVVEDKVCL